MIHEECRLRIPGLIERIPAVCAFVVEAARRAGLDERAVHHCQLAVDEACTNVIEHGYGGNAPDQALDITCRSDNERFSVTVSDSSPPFDPLTRADPDPASPLEERAPGGWGILFIKKVMDEVIYQYDSRRNSLMMVKYRQPEPQVDSKSKLAARVSIHPLLANVLCISPHGRLDADLCPGISDMIGEQLDAGNKLLVMDMGDVDYVSSMGLKTLVSLWQRVRSIKGEIVLAALHPRVREVLQIIGLDLVFSLYATPAQAANALSKRAD